MGRCRLRIGVSNLNKQTEYTKRYKDRLRASGKCIQGDGKPISARRPKSGWCDEHVERSNAYYRELQKSMRDALRREKEEKLRASQGE